MAAHQKLDLHSENPRNKILATAANMFLNQGYAATTLRELARESGVNIGSLMHLFKNKENILCALVPVVLGGQFRAAEDLLKDVTDDPILFWAAETTLQLYITTYSLPKTADLIRRSIAKSWKRTSCHITPGSRKKIFTRWKSPQAASFGDLCLFPVICILP
ncbi:MAG: TetR/AcrR family transcriptional regulator [Oscillospiraceae bacterium]|nr:TetR/AcrR family transcriptional regulator [Oscillospiraceae bacterium]